jgi:hypothetical protein
VYFSKLQAVLASMNRYLRLFMAVGLIVAPLRSEATHAPTEYEVKAAFIYNFSKYIQWPKGFDTSKPFVIAIIGKDPFGVVLDDAVFGQKVQGRSVIIKRFTRIDDIPNCDILFVAASESSRLPQIFGTLHQAPVLTVGDVNRFAERGGMINLTTADNRIRFEVNVRALERAGLKAGSQLLRLARIVNEARADGQ